MESLGEHLKRERELRGVTIEEIAHITRISTRFLNAIEDNNYGSLPDVFVKGFLRAYSKCVGLDPNEIISIYENIKIKTETPLPPAASAAAIQTSKLNPFIAAAALMLIIIVGFVYYIYSKPVPSNFNRGTDTSAAVKKKLEPDTSTIVPSRKNSLIEEQKPAQSDLEYSPPENSMISPHSESDITPPIQSIPGGEIQESYNIKKPVPAGLPSNVFIEGFKQREENAVKEIGVLTPEIVSGKPPVQTIQKHITLTITATETVWLQVVIDDSEIKEATLEPGGKIFVKALEKFSLTTGNVKGTEAVFNGVRLSLPSTRSNVLRNYLLTRDNG